MTRPTPSPARESQASDRAAFQPYVPASAAMALLIVSLAVGATAQSPAARRATNLAALLAHPTFYHQRPVLIVGTLTLQPNGALRMQDETGSILVLYKEGSPEGLNEIRGEFWDLGRMNHDDPRLTAYDLRTTFQIDPDGAWPRPGQVTAIVASAITQTTPPGTPSIRGLVLFPSRYLDQKVTLVGQFSGRNLLGDLPDALGNSRYDFVVRSADAAVWVSNLRPRGRDFELSVDARLDTGRWVQVGGVVKQSRGLVWLDGTDTTITIAKAPAETTADASPIRVPAGPPPEVVFSAPTSDETDVALSTSIRIQFSRDLNPATLRNRVRVRYAGANAGDRSTLDTVEVPAADFTTQYTAATRVVEIRFGKPLEPFRSVHIELGDGILGRDEQPLKPWMLTFATGGS